jgi:hypothetical protein
MDQLEMRHEPIDIGRRKRRKKLIASQQPLNGLWTDPGTGAGMVTLSSHDSSQRQILFRRNGPGLRQNPLLRTGDCSGRCGIFRKVCSHS